MMKKVKILRTTTASGKRVESGKIHSLSYRDAEILVGMGKAELVANKKVAAKAAAQPADAAASSTPLDGD